MNLLIPNLQPQQLSFSKTLSQCHFFCNNNNNKLSQATLISKPIIILMGGGLKTYPGGVTKLQWKRIKMNKAKQLWRDRHSRESQIYKMRKRDELKAAVSELERPWEVVQKSPNLFSIAADEQVKVLADRFQKLGGFETPDELPSARVFPKGVVHSIGTYRKVELDDDDEDGENGGSFGGEFSKMINEWEFLTKGADDGSDDGEFSSPLNYGRNEVSGDGSRTKSGYGRNEVNVDGRRSKNGNGRRFFSKGVKGPSGSDGGERSSPLNYDKNGMSGDGRARKNGNERRFMSEGVDGFNGEFSSPLNYERNELNVDGRTRKNENGRRFMARSVNDIDGEFSSPMNYGRNGVNVNDKTRSNGNRRFISKDDIRLDGSDEERSSSPLKHRRNGMSGDGRMMRDENERRFMSKDIGRSNGLNTGRVGSDRKQGGSNSVRGKNYSRGTSGYASGRSRDADSEIYDMGLQQDASYQSDSKSW